ncbi:MAG: hypothetical protein HYT93_04530 [Parcubacteria group bacterium]|nr:hypothetical protein [Parcubacteria group bacterium]
MFKTILQKLSVLVSLVLMVLGVYFAYMEYSLFRIEVERQDDPLIQYTFEDDKGAFVVSGGNDIEIKEVSWSMPSIAATAPLRINEHPRILTVEDLKQQLYDDSTYILTGLSPHDREYFVRCGILGNTHSIGIPLVAEITFRQRGVVELGKTLALVYAEWLSSEYPYIEVYEENASEEQKTGFIKKSVSELKERFINAAGEGLLTSASAKDSTECIAGTGTAA